MIDHYTKAVLTIIAAALVMLAVDRVIPKALAQSGACGSSENPCHVTDDGACGDTSGNACYIKSNDTLDVRVQN
jgi:hypothetical protein